MFGRSECDIIAQMLWDYADQSLDGLESDRVDVHLERCEACRREAEAIRATAEMVGVVRNKTIPDSASTWMELREELENANQAAVARRPLFQRFGPAWAIAFAGALAGLMYLKMSATEPAVSFPMLSRTALGPQDNNRNQPDESAASGTSKVLVAPVKRPSVRTAASNPGSDEEPDVQIRRPSKFNHSAAPIRNASVAPGLHEPVVKQAFDREPVDGGGSVSAKHNFVISPAAYPDNDGTTRQYVMGSILDTRGRTGTDSRRGGEEGPVW